MAPIHELAPHRAQHGMSQRTLTAAGGRLSQWKCDEPLTLVSGACLSSFTLAYTTYGKLNNSRSNAVLICPALNASSVVCSHEADEDAGDGWWNDMVGIGRPIDTQYHFVICIANIGSCFGSTESRSINPTTGRPFGGDFPYVTINDWVESQARLIRHLGITQLAAVVGGSMGGMQALQWAIAFPDRVRNAVVIASTAKLDAQNIAFNQVARQAILADPNYLGGNYVCTSDAPAAGLKIARMLGHITYTSKDRLNRKFGRAQKTTQFRHGPGIKFEVESYLNHQGARFAESFDANAYLRITLALDHFDIARDHGGGSLRRAAEKVQADVLLICFADDWRFGPEHSAAIADALRRARKTVVLHEIQGKYGHDGFLLDDVRYHQIMRAYFSRIHAKTYGR